MTSVDFKIPPQTEDETVIDAVSAESCNCNEGWLFDECGKGHLCERCEYWNNREDAQ